MFEDKKIYLTHSVWASQILQNSAHCTFAEFWALSDTQDLYGKIYLDLPNQLMNDDGVCKSAPGVARVCNFFVKPIFEEEKKTMF